MNQQSNIMPNRVNADGALGYDLESEKQRILLGTQELKKEIAEKYAKKYANAQIFPAPIASMHPEVVDFLLSFNLVSVYDNIAKQANLDGKGRNSLPRVVWQIAQSKNWDGLDQILEAQIPMVHSVHVQVADLLKQNILDKIQVLSEKPVVQKTASIQAVKKEIQLPLAKALADFPKLGEQNITTEQIKLRVMQVPVRPSIKNWIMDFHDVMGAKRHSQIDRGNFLFHGENGKKLSPYERQKLATILKSLDEQTLLKIDVESERVIFENIEEQSSAINNKPAPLAERLSKVESLDNIRRSEPVATQNHPQTFAVAEKMAPVKEEKVENFFQIPQSKPPIGSNDFHAENVVSVDRAPQEIKKEIQPNLEGITDDELFEQIKKRNASIGNVVGGAKSIIGLGGQEKSQNNQAGTSPNFASVKSKITFSSPQKLPAEQISKTLQTPLPQVSNMQNHVEQSQPKVQGNTVNLREN